MSATSPRRSRGRPVGGGKTAEEARTALLDAAEELILDRGFGASTMESIAARAGYSRAAIYQHFPNRQKLLEALVRRKTGLHQAQIIGRLPETSDLATLLVESLVIVSTELIHDPLLMTLSEQTEDGTIAHLIANVSGLPEQIGQLVAAIAEHTGSVLRPGLAPGDIATFLVTTALTLLLGIVPGSDAPDTARRYLQTFVMPAILADPPAPGPVFG
ncbi:TetR/AcrR family transcriptional regulator [Mycobacterium sp. MBM]|nr:TetR/AcrR family transcriptional regulator [Mycobacterium sp. MBM]